MRYKDLHTHTNFCDGKTEPEAMVLSAIEKGIDTLGILAHSYVEFDKSCSIDPGREEEFIKEVNRLKEKYRDKIKLLAGIEKDYYTTSARSDYDYILGSVHYFMLDGEYYPIDQSPEDFVRLVKEHFDGDYYAAAEEYYRLEAEVATKTGADVIAHFDLITKFNQDGRLFDTKHPRYVKAWQRAADALLEENLPFEVNTGAISRGYRREPYPSDEILEYVKAHGGSLMLSSDAHAPDNIGYMFESCEKLLLGDGNCKKPKKTPKSP